MGACRNLPAGPLTIPTPAQSGQLASWPCCLASPIVRRRPTTCPSRQRQLPPQRRDCIVSLELSPKLVGFSNSATRARIASHGGLPRRGLLLTLFSQGNGRGTLV